MFRPAFVFYVLVTASLLPGCGFEDLFKERDGDDASNHPAVPAAAEIDATGSLQGEMFGEQFIPRSVLFSTGLNAAGVEETHILAASAANYCEHIRDGIEQERSLRMMLRVVRYTSDTRAAHAGPGAYEQAEWVPYYNDTQGIAAPGPVPLESGFGNALTAGVARVRKGCRGQRLVAAAPGSLVTIDAHDFTGLRGHASLRFSNYGFGDSAGDGGDSLNGKPVRLGGTFVATPCPWLGQMLARDPQAGFQAAQCMPQAR